MSKKSLEQRKSTPGFSLIRASLRENLVSSKQGFSLIELLVVITIIGILAGLSTFGFRGARETARDTQRKSDLEQYKNALEVYANINNGLYPTNTTNNGALAASTLCGYLSMTNCPEDPTYAVNTAWGQYRYQSNGSGTAGLPTATRYVLWARIEQAASSSTTQYWVTCSNGKSGELSTGIPPATGTCPLP